MRLTRDLIFFQQVDRLTSKMKPHQIPPWVINLFKTRQDCSRGTVLERHAPTLLKSPRTVLKITSCSLRQTWPKMTNRYQSTMTNPQVLLSRLRRWKIVNNPQILQGNHACWRSTSARNVRGVSLQVHPSASTNTLARSSHASTATRPTFHWERWKCTFARILCLVSARFAAKRSAGRGYSKVTFARTQARSHISARTASVRSPTVRICVLTCRRIPPWKSTAARNVRVRFPECHFYTNTSTLAELNCELNLGFSFSSFIYLIFSNNWQLAGVENSDKNNFVGLGIIWLSRVIFKNII